MDSRAKVLGHSAHQLLIVFPLGLLATAAAFDTAHLVTGDPVSAVVAYWMIASGVVGGVVASPFGWIDWAAVPRGTRAKGVGLAHGLVNTVVTGLFVASWFLRRPVPDAPGTAALALSYAGVGLALIGGWLGGELVGRLAVGVDDGAHLNSPNSLSRRPAHETAGDGPETI